MVCRLVPRLLVVELMKFIPALLRVPCESAIESLMLFVQQYSPVGACEQTHFRDLWKAVVLCELGIGWIYTRTCSNDDLWSIGTKRFVNSLLETMHSVLDLVVVSAMTCAGFEQHFVWRALGSELSITDAFVLDERGLKRTFSKTTLVVVVRGVSLVVNTISLRLSIDIPP
ncbi:hypothetical protein Tco_0017750 [Tanacetum coccineum]